LWNSSSFIIEIKQVDSTIHDSTANSESICKKLWDRFVYGLRSKAIQKCLLVKTDLKLDNELAMAQGIEAATKHASELCMATRAH
jgi:hypothetical protein